MDYQRTNGHSLSRLIEHLVWVTKYRYSVLEGNIKLRRRSILFKVFHEEDVRVLKGVVSKDHMHIEYRPNQDISTLVKLFKGRSSRKIQVEFPKLKERYWSRHFSAMIWFWNTGNITDEMLNEYLVYHRNPTDEDTSNFIIE